ncbi:MAG: hypothetical protein KBD83_01230 [Gammaproteobacteria bacterium]|nr:hypothetical protein [Gammaproteobacteria bacterium]
MSRVKPVFRCDEALKRKFSASKCLLTISVGQEVHEGEKFLSTVHLVDRNFNACIMLIDDTLQRHTMAMQAGLEEGDEMLDASLKAGDAWLNRNRAAYSQMHIPLVIIRWNEFLLHKKYAFFKSMLKETYKTDIAYQASFDKTIDQFLARYSRHHQEKNYVVDARARRLCLEYLLEECTAMCLWSELGCEFEVYPSYRNPAMDETHRRFILPDFPKLLHAVSIKFKNKAQLSPQKFEFSPKVVENRAAFD